MLLMEISCLFKKGCLFLVTGYWLQDFTYSLELTASFGLFPHPHALRGNA